MNLLAMWLRTWRWGAVSLWLVVGVAEAMTLSPLTVIEVADRVEVAKSEVYMADLVVARVLPPDWREHFASIYVGEAPGPGEVKYVQVELLTDYLRKLLQGAGQDVQQVTIVVPKEIVVVRKVETIPVEEIEQIFTDYVMAHVPWKVSDVEISKIRYAGLAVVPSGERNVEVVADPHEDFLGAVTLTVHVMVEGKRVQSFQVSGMVDVYDQVLHAARGIAKGDTVEPEAFVAKRARVTDDPKDYGRSDLDVVGKRAVKEIAAGEPLRLSFLENPIVVTKGDIVRVVINKPGLAVSMKAEVKDDGRIGDKVKVMNLSSRKVIQGRVRDRQTVVVSE